MRLLVRLIEDEFGGVSVESALLLVLISVSSVVAYRAFGQVIADRATQASILVPGGGP